MKKSIVMCLVLLFISGSALAQPRDRMGPGGRGHRAPHMKALFPPELVMAHSRELGLSEEQRNEIIAAMQKMQTELVPLQFEVREQAQALGDLLEANPVDTEAALAQVDQIAALETQVKKTHLGLLIYIKNLLNADQLAQLAELRRQRRGGRPEKDAPPVN